MKEGFFSGKTAKDIALYYKRSNIIKLFTDFEKSREDSGLSENQDASSRQRRSSRATSSSSRDDLARQRQQQQVILDFLESVNIPIKEQVPLCAILLKAGFDIKKIAYSEKADYQGLGIKQAFIIAILGGRDKLKIALEPAPVPILKKRQSSQNSESDTEKELVSSRKSFYSSRRFDSSEVTMKEVTPPPGQEETEIEEPTDQNAADDVL